MFSRSAYLAAVTRKHCFQDLDIKQNIQRTTIVTTYLSTRKINILIQAASPSINTSEGSLTKAQMYTLAKLRTNILPFLLSYKFDASHNPSVPFLAQMFTSLHTYSFAHIFSLSRQFWICNEL